MVGRLFVVFFLVLHQLGALGGYTFSEVVVK